MGAQKTFGIGVGAWQETPGDVDEPHQLDLSGDSFRAWWSASITLRVLSGWPEVGVCGSQGQLTGDPFPEKKNHLFAADGSSDQFIWNIGGSS